MIHFRVEVSEASTARCSTHSWSGRTCSLEMFAIPVYLTTQISCLFCVATDQIFFFQLYGLNPGMRFVVFGDEELLLVFGRFQLVTELLNLLMEGMEFGLEVLLLLLEDLCMFLLSLTRCESMISVRKTG